MKLRLILVLLILGNRYSLAQTNLIGNGSFEYVNGTGFPGCSGANGSSFVEGYVQCWDQIEGSSDIVPDDFPSGYFSVSPYDGSRMAHCAQFDGGSCTYNNEAIAANISIQANKGYLLRFALNAYAAGNYFRVELTNNVTVATNCSTCYVVPITGAQVLYNEYHTTNTTWQIIEVYFTASKSFNQMIFYPYESGPGGYSSDFLIDKVELFEFCDTFLVDDSYNLNGPYYYGDYIEVSDDATGIPFAGFADPYDDIHLISGKYIIMLPNFESHISTSGTYFLGEIDPCDPQQDPVCIGSGTFASGEEKVHPDGYIDIHHREIKTCDISVSNKKINISSLTDDVMIQEYTIYTIGGQIITNQEGLREKRVSYDLLSTGMYIIHITMSDGTMDSFKVVL